MKLSVMERNRDAPSKASMAVWPIIELTPIGVHFWSLIADVAKCHHCRRSLLRPILTLAAAHSLIFSCLASDDTAGPSIVDRREAIDNREKHNFR